MKLYVAVVFTKTEDGSGFVAGSRRVDGDWSCFVAKDKKSAIEKALAAKRRWDGTSSTRCEYRVLVGTLTQEAEVPIKFDLKPLK